MKMVCCGRLFVKCCKLAWVLLHPACHLRTYQGDQLTSVFHGILEGIEATDQQRGFASLTKHCHMNLPGERYVRATIPAVTKILSRASGSSTFQPNIISWS